MSRLQGRPWKRYHLKETIGKTWFSACQRNDAFITGRIFATDPHKKSLEIHREITCTINRHSGSRGKSTI